MEYYFAEAYALPVTFDALSRCLKPPEDSHPKIQPGTITSGVQIKPECSKTPSEEIQQARFRVSGADPVNATNPRSSEEIENSISLEDKRQRCNCKIEEKRRYALLHVATG